MCNIFEACILSAHHNTACNSDNKKHLELKDTMILTDSSVAKIITNAVEDR